MVKVKICGITNLGDAEKACEYGADLLGFIFVEGTPRHVEPEEAGEMIRELRKEYKNTEMVGLFKDEDVRRVKDTAISCNLGYVQLHGEEAPGYCHELKNGNTIKIIKAFKVDEQIVPHGPHGLEDYLGLDYFVFDTYDPEISGGTGASFNWNVLAGLEDDVRNRSFIAGGLNPGNVNDVIKTLRPYGVDVSSGVEKSPGWKDLKLLKEFIENAKKA